MIKNLFFLFENLIWNIQCRYNLWLHGPYGLTKVIEKMPFKFIPKYLRKYGASIGEKCVIERGLRIHRPASDLPFKNLKVENNVYLGHNVLLDLTDVITIEENVKIGADSHLWTHVGYFENLNSGEKHYKEDVKEVLIKNGAIIYSNVVVMQGISVGSFARVGANSLVNKTIPANQFWGGVPVKEIKI